MEKTIGCKDCEEGKYETLLIDDSGCSVGDDPKLPGHAIGDYSWHCCHNTNPLKDCPLCGPPPKICFCGGPDWSHQPGEVTIICSENETSILQNLKRKEADAEKMGREMTTRVCDILSAEIKGTKKEWNDYKPTKTMIVPKWIGEELNESIGPEDTRKVCAL